MNQRLVVEGLERQLAVLEAMRDDSLGDDIDVCIETTCFLPRADHQRQSHNPTYWPIDQAIPKLRQLITDASSVRDGSA